jgi:subtilisin family serine protease
MVERIARIAGALLLCACTLGLIDAAAAGAAPKKPAGPNDPLWARQWGLRAAGGAALWKWGHGSRRVVVAVLDTGVDATHPDLHGALAGTSDAHDDNGHGTLVAGIVAARAGNKRGIAGYCSGCSVMPVKVLDAAGRGSGSTIAAGIDWAVAHGATVVNMSFNLDRPDDDVALAVADAAAHGVLVVAAAGNGGGVGAQYPASFPGVLSIAGVDPGGTLYPWSTFGSWTHASMPGCNETTAAGGGYDDFCGSSSAAAAASGLLGLAASDAPDTRSRLQSLLAQHVAGTARRIDALGFLRAATQLERSLRRR